MIIHLHFHIRKTGITKHIESIIPFLNEFSDARVFGYGINAPKISFLSLLKTIYSSGQTVLHAHRNNEMIFALFLRLLGGKFRLVFTRHSETMPADFTSYLMKRADHLVSLSHSMSINLPYKNTLINHGVNTEIFKIRGVKKLINIPQNNLISVIGRIRPAKGQITVLEAVISLFKQFTDWGLVLIGKIDDNQYAKKILTMAQENEISSQVHIMPESNEIANYYHASRIVVIASMSEGFSLVCLEAMSCGLITIATESVGIHSEVITHGENGFLFPKCDSHSLGNIISDIMYDRINLNPEKIRQSILDSWDIKRSVSELRKLYEINPGEGV